MWADKLRPQSLKVYMKEEQRMKRILSLVLAVVMVMGGLAYAVDNGTIIPTDPSAVESPTESPMPDEADVTIDPETDEPTVVVKGTTLVKDVDYILSYKDNINVGMATVVITFIGNYTGLREQTFNILPKPTSKPSYGGGGGGGGGSRSTRVTLAEATQQPTAEPVFIYHESYINGYDDGTFRPDAYITRAEAAAMLSRIMPTETPIPEPTSTPSTNTRPTSSPAPTSMPAKSFIDVKTTDWFYSSVKIMAQKGMIDGYDDSTFRPDTHITRAEFITMLTRGQKEKFVGVPFNDVLSNRWYADYIYTAYIHKYIDGYGDGTFRPDNKITRSEVVKIINGYLGRYDYSNENNPFKDITNSHWAFKEILEAAVDHKIEEQ